MKSRGFGTLFVVPEKVFGIFEPESIVALSAIFMPHNRYLMTLEARTDGNAILLDKNEIIRLAQTNLQVASRLLKNFSRQMYGFINEIDWLTSSSAEQRMAAYLLELLARQKQTGKVDPPLAKSQVINMNNQPLTLKNMAYLRDLASASERSF